MNKLVEYLSEFHHPGGNSFKIVAVDEILSESGFTVEQVHEMALETSMELAYTIQKAVILTFLHLKIALV